MHVLKCRMDDFIANTCIVQMLPADQQNMATVYHYGYISEEALFAREAIRAAREGQTLEQAHARLQRLERRTFFAAINSYETFRDLAKSGRSCVCYIHICLSNYLSHIYMSTHATFM